MFNFCVNLIWIKLMRIDEWWREWVVRENELEWEQHKVSSQRVVCRASQLSEWRVCQVGMRFFVIDSQERRHGLLRFQNQKVLFNIRSDALGQHLLQTELLQPPINRTSVEAERAALPTLKLPARTGVRNEVSEK
jgi:hypothetical protein